MAIKSWSLATLIKTFFFFFVSIFVGHAARVPFLSRHLPEPIPKHDNITDLESVGAAYTHVLTLTPYVMQTWHGECFRDNYGYVTFTGDFGHGHIIISPSNAKNTWCRDYYQFRVGDQTIATDSIFSGLTVHKTEFDPNDSDLRQKIAENGVSVYMWKNGLNVEFNQREEAFEQRSQLGGGIATIINVNDCKIQIAGNSITSEDIAFSAA